MQLGTVKHWRGTWGHIAPDGGGSAVFVHQSVIEMEGYRSLVEGQRVQFEIANDERGARAVRVTPVAASVMDDDALWNKETR